MSFPIKELYDNMEIRRGLFNMDRRNFIKLGLATVASGMLFSCQNTSALDDWEVGEMPTRSLG